MDISVERIQNEVLLTQLFCYIEMQGRTGRQALAPRDYPQMLTAVGAEAKCLAVCGSAQQGAQMKFSGFGHGEV